MRLEKFKAALIQHAIKPSLDQTLSFISAQVKKAALDGAKLVALQELHNTPYFCQSENPDFFDLEDFDSSIDFYSTLAKECEVVLVTSLFEKRPDDPNFYEKFYFTPGDLGFEPISTSLGKLGVLVCWDQWYPEAARIMALKGAEILIYPTAIGWFRGDSQDEKVRQKEAWIAIQRAHAIANGIPVLSINRVGFEPDISGVSDGILFWGGSFGFGAQGELLAQASSENEEILMLEIDLKRSEEVRRIWPFLRDRRIDSYSDILKRYCL